MFLGVPIFMHNWVYRNTFTNADFILQENYMLGVHVILA